MGFKFENLLVWRKAVDLSDNINKLTKEFPKDGIYILTSQTKQVADTVSLNIAEGSTGQSKAEFVPFPRYALDSNIEAANYLHLARRQKFINDTRSSALSKNREEVLVMINSLIKSLK